MAHPLHVGVDAPEDAAPVRRQGWRTWPMWERLAFLAIVFLPFQRAFTVNVGAPLKLTEIFIVLAVPLWFVSAGRRRRPWSFVDTCVVLIGILVAVSWMVRSSGELPVGPQSGIETSAEFDLAYYTLLALFVLTGWMVLSQLSVERIARALAVAVVICLVLAVVQYLFYVAGAVDVLSALQFSNKTGGAYGIRATRTATFQEGQHLGFFASVAFFVCLRQRYYWAAGAAAVLILYSQSTTSIGATAIALVVVTLLRFDVRYHALLATLAVVGLASYLVSPGLQSFVAFQGAKVGIDLGQTDAQYTDQSLDVRSEKTGMGWDMMSDHLFLGVGPGRYAAHFYEYVTGRDLPGFYFNNSGRAVAENAYAQLGAETGVIALAAFLAILALALGVLVMRGTPFDIALVVVVAVGAWTLSSWTFWPLWVALALIAVLVWQTRVPTDDADDASASGAEVVDARVRPGLDRA